uniref:ribonuclease H1-like isoform X1 n=1 Tax=Ciona intestinalis TaxID=7719 RepID=UPI000180BF60|nr:ribonuclease H1-like isoform X1 [Ciona intestinalis]|eukprot:XP_002128178.1 ribonuclease H1-like isoform X1 [Ciona intestinalis]
MLRCCIRTAIMKSFYAVHIGKSPGVYDTWPECLAQVSKFKGAKYKKFSNKDEASYFAHTGTELSKDKSDILDIFKDELADNSAKESKPNNIPQSSIVSRKRKVKPDSNSRFGKVQKTNDQPTNADSSDGSCPVVYTDGACSKNGRKGSRAGYGVWWGDDHKLNFSARLPGIPTNQRAEIAAVNKAIKQAIDVGHKQLLIRTDSKFVIDCITKWVQGWIRKGWVKADGKPVIHKVEFQEMLKNMKKINVKFEHVFGHRGNYGNEMADKLAVQGATMPYLLNIG